MQHKLKVSGLERIQNPTLLDSSQHAAGGGGLCGAVLYEVKKPITVYRVSAWSQDKSPDYYNWWSFENPLGSSERYRKDNVMCNE